MTVTQVVNFSADKVIVVVSGPSGDVVFMLKLQGDGSVEKIAMHEMDKKIQRLALDAQLVYGSASKSEGP